VSLPDIAIGSSNAPVTITEFASMSCPHCAAFGENVFPMLRSNMSIAAGCFVFREFPLDIKAVGSLDAGAMHRADDAEKYLGAVESVQEQERLMAETKDTLNSVGKLNGMSEQDVERCVRDQALLEPRSPPIKDTRWRRSKVDRRRPSRQR